MMLWTLDANIRMSMLILGWNVCFRSSLYDDDDDDDDDDDNNDEDEDEDEDDDEEGELIVSGPWLARELVSSSSFLFSDAIL